MHNVLHYYTDCTLMINDSVENLEFKKATDAIYWLYCISIYYVWCILYQPFIIIQLNIIKSVFLIKLIHKIINEIFQRNLQNLTTIIISHIP